MTRSAEGASDRPSAASGFRRAVAQARFEAGIMLRNGEQLLVALVLPALALVGLTRAPWPDLGPQPRIDVVAPGVLALAVVSSAFTAQAIQTGFDRRYGVLRQLGTTPLGSGGLLAGKAMAVLVVLAVQVVALGGLALGLGWRPHALLWLELVPLLALGAWVCVALALVLAGAFRAEAVLALANLIWVLVLGFGGVVAPPAGLTASVVSLLPPGALAGALRSASVEGATAISQVCALFMWAAVATAVVTRTFDWRD